MHTHKLVRMIHTYRDRGERNGGTTAVFARGGDVDPSRSEIGGHTAKIGGYADSNKKRDPPRLRR